MDEQAETFLREHETCYAYNYSFKYYYKQSMPRKEAQKLVDRRNECKGGHWEVRRLVDYREHFESLIDHRCAGDGS